MTSCILLLFWLSQCITRFPLPVKKCADHDIKCHTHGREVLERFQVQGFRTTGHRAQPGLSDEKQKSNKSRKSDYLEQTLRVPSELSRLCTRHRQSIFHIKTDMHTKE